MPFWNPFATALSFLTIFRVPCSMQETFDPADLARSFSFFPLIGLLLGGCWLLGAMPLASRMDPFLLAALLTTLMALLTRALHLDGLADCADGFGGGYTPERRLEIMKDSRSGAFGALALALAVALKISAIHSLVEHHAWSGLLLAPVLSRFAIVLSAYKIPYARKEGGLGRPFLEHMTSRHLLAAALFALAPAVLLCPKSFPLFIAATLATVAFMRHYASRLLGGITGDVLGATNEITEIVLLALATCLA